MKSARFVSLLLGMLAAVILGRAEALSTPADEMRRLIYGVPKTELHIHLEGTLEPEHYLELVQRNRLTPRYATGQDVRDRLKYAKDLNTFIEVYEELLSAMRTREDFREVAMAYFTKVRSQGVVYVEMFFDPQMHTTRGVPLGVVMEGLGAARKEAREKLGLRAEYIMCFNRDRSAESAMAILEASRPWSGLILGVGLDNPEELDFPVKFQAVFARAKELGLRLTSHCDVNQPNTLEHIRGCLDLLKVERIDHGVNVLDDPALINRVREQGVGLTVCVTELYLEIPGRVEARAKAVKRMLDLGLRVSIHSDDPGLMRSNYVADCLRLAQEAAGLSRAEVITLVKNGFHTAWLTDDERRAYLEAVDAFVAR